ncbi:MAG: PDZ domain-containing protein, partial [Candidatus Peregrinibacteria bacterium]
MKKTLHLFLLFIFLIFQSSSALAFFSDVPEDHEFYLSIKSLYNLNLLPAFENDLYQPDEYVTKEDLFKFILSYGKSESDIEVELPPSDSANTLPKNYVLAKIFEFLGIGTTYFIQEENFPFIDVKIGTSTSATAMKAAEVGIFENENPTMYKKGRRITKGELAYYLFKVYRYDPGTVSVTYEFDIPSQNSTTAAEDNLLNNKTFSTFADVYSTITNDYYYQDEIDESSLIFGAIKGMIDRLNDQYTVFQEPSEASEFLNTLSPENYEGIGILIELIDNNVTVISPFRGSPAEDAGLKPNDIIKKVDGKSIQDLTLEEIIGLIKGQKGTTVDLSIERNGHNLEFEVKRDFILYSSVQYQILQTNSGKNIGYIELWIFDEN